MEGSLRELAEYRIASKEDVEKQLKDAEIFLEKLEAYLEQQKF